MSLLDTLLLGDRQTLIAGGRILAAAGSISDSLSIPLDPARVSVSFIPAAGVTDPSVLLLLENGEPRYLDEERAKVILSQEDINIAVDLGLGDAQATYWTCDLSHVCFFPLLPVLWIRADRSLGVCLH